MHWLEFATILTSWPSTMPLVRGEADALDLVAYGESIELATNFGASPLRYVRRGPWKYVHHDVPELYEVVADPRERENRAAVHPERVAALRAALETLLAGASRPGDATASVTPEDRARLEALGYAVGSEAARDAIDLDSLAWRGPSPASLVDEVREMTETLERAGLGEAGGAERRALLERALALSKCAMEARLELAEVLAAAGEHAARRDVLRDGVERCGEVPELLNNYASSNTTPSAASSSARTISACSGSAPRRRCSRPIAPRRSRRTTSDMVPPAAWCRSVAATCSASRINSATRT
jgi:hypothetical protein